MTKHSGKENFDVVTDSDDIKDFLLPKKALVAPESSERMAEIMKDYISTNKRKTPHMDVMSFLNGRPKGTRMQWGMMSFVPTICLTSQYHGY